MQGPLLLSPLVCFKWSSSSLYIVHTIVISGQWNAPPSRKLANMDAHIVPVPVNVTMSSCSMLLRYSKYLHYITNTMRVPWKLFARTCWPAVRPTIHSRSRAKGDVDWQRCYIVNCCLICKGDFIPSAWATFCWLCIPHTLKTVILSYEQCPAITLLIM
jgi:hypothetical protein